MVYCIATGSFSSPTLLPTDKADPTEDRGAGVASPAARQAAAAHWRGHGAPRERRAPRHTGRRLATANRRRPSCRHVPHARLRFRHHGRKGT